MIETILRHNINAQKHGMLVIMNMDKLTLKQCRQITPFVVQKMVNIFYVRPLFNFTTKIFDVVKYILRMGHFVSVSSREHFPCNTRRFTL